MQKASSSSPLTLAITAFSVAPIHFLLLQVPEALIDLADQLNPTFFETHSLLAFVLLFPAYCLASGFTSALTFASLLQYLDGKKPKLSISLERIGARWKTLSIVSLLLGTVTLLGLMALIVPGLYFMAVYLFVPELVVLDSPRAAGSYMAQLDQSKRLAKSQFAPTFMIVVLVFVSGIALYFGSEFLGGTISGAFQNPIVRVSIHCVTKGLLSLVFGTAVDMGIACYFLKLKDTYENNR